MTRALIAVLSALALGASPALAQRDSTAAPPAEAPLDSMPHTMEPPGFPMPVTPPLRAAPPAATPPVDEHAPTPSPVPSSAAPRVTSTFRRTSEETDRFELGGAAVRGFFDAVGSLAYRRFMGEHPGLEQSLMAELAGTAKDQLTEGVFSVYFLMRPTATYRESWRLRPLVEFGPAIHTVFQVASLEGLSRTRYKSEVYLKTHGYAGFEALLTRRWGLLARGRISIPSHRPLDYAQAAIFLR